ncbi:unnamed protein product [Sphagnum troendelagicum]|uniref:Uncharacterized protein n=1 Tax=Sphagnum troendelagicum TaxID=128251 RepID=A0ABP0TWV8_9BRYO
MCRKSSGTKQWLLHTMQPMEAERSHTFSVKEASERSCSKKERKRKNKVQAFALEELCFFEKPLLFLRSSLCSVPYQLAVVAKELKEELQL